MWTTGMDWGNLESLAAQQEPIIEQVAQLARQHQIWINGSMLTLNQHNQPTNTSILLDPQGTQAGVYHKIHLFGVMGEDQYLAAGQHLTTVETSWGQSGLAICYDLRFAEMFRTYALQGVNMVYVRLSGRIPAWPTGRRCCGHGLLKIKCIW
jgi:omega-amidase